MARPDRRIQCVFADFQDLLARSTARSARLGKGVTLACVAGVALLAAPGPIAQEVIAVEHGTPIRWIAQNADPGIPMQTWIQRAFDDSAWGVGEFGIGFEVGTSGVADLAATTVPTGTRSLYARAVFDVTDRTAIANMFLGVDYDDGVTVWLNGVELYRSPEVPDGDLFWDTAVGSHESSNGVLPYYEPLIDVSWATQYLTNGPNVLAIACWNATSASTDMIAAPQLILNRAISVVRGPYLQQLGPDRVTVKWRTSAPTGTQLIYGPAPFDLSFETNATAKTEHRVTVTGLEPNTKYFYAVGNVNNVFLGGNEDYYFLTQPPPGTPKKLRIWVTGDVGTGDFRARRVRDWYDRLTGDEHTDLWMLLGDLAYEDGTDAEFQTKFFEVYDRIMRSSPGMPTFGNHDGFTADSQTLAGPYYDIFDLPWNAQLGGLASGTEAYYSYDLANVHFVVLNSYDIDRATDAPMVEWLELDLAATTQDWIIAYWHHPPYSKGGHDSDVDLRMREMRENIVPVLDANGVDLTFVGHSHDYERSVLMDGHYNLSTDFGPQHEVDGGDGRVAGDGAYIKPMLGPIPNSGTVHTVTGSAGKISGGPLNHPAMVSSLNVLGAVILEIDGDVLDARFIDDDGEERDHFRMVKGSGYQLPQANFQAEPITGEAPLTVQFNDASLNGVDTWSWDVDDDGQEDSAISSPSVTFDEPGLYTVSQRVQNIVGVDTMVKPDLVCVTGGVPGPMELLFNPFGMVWGLADQPATYDLVRGELAPLLASRGDFATTRFRCAVNDFAGNLYDDPVDPTGDFEVFFYLLRATNCALQAGGFDTGVFTQVGTRNPAFVDSVNACACEPACDLDEDGLCDQQSSCTGGSR